MSQNSRPKKDTEIITEKINQRAPLEMSEIGEPGPIEQVTEHDLLRAMAHEDFMNESLTIIVHQDNGEGALDIINPTVGTLNQPIIRGVNQKVKRKYVEVLARTRTDTYTQYQADPENRASLKMRPRSVLTYPFSVIHDPNPRGRDWIEHIMRQVQ